MKKILYLLLIIAGPLVVCSAQQGKEPAAPVQEGTTMPVVGEEKDDDYDEIYSIVDKKAEFPGGKEELLRYIQENLEYPEKHMAERVEGRSFVRFIVRKDGSIDDVKVVRGGDPLFDAEAIRAVRNMPKWIPARQRGEAVSSFYTVPVTFKLPIPRN